MTDWDRILQNQKPISVEYNINPPNFMQMNEALCFMYNTNFKLQNETIERLDRIEKLLENKGE